MRAFSSVVFLLLSFFTLCNSHGQVTFEKTYGDNQFDYGYSVQQTADGGYILLGVTTSWSGFSYYWKLIKTDSLGEVEWQKIHGDDFSLVSAGAVKQTSDRGYIICGSLGGPFTDSLVLMKVDDQGNLTWKNSYHVALGRSIGKSVEQTSDGGFIVTGYGGEIMREDVYAIKTDPNGALEWSRIYGGSEIDRGICVKQNPDGTYLILGETKSFGNGGFDVFVLKLSSSGDTLWTKTYGTTKNEGGYALDLTFDGGFILAGVGGSNQNRNFYVIKADALGNKMWDKEYGGDGYDFGNSIDQTEDGGFFITGQRTLTPGQSEMYCIKTNGVGDIYWERGFRKGEVNEAYSAHQTRDGGYIILGTTIYPDTLSTSFMYLVKTGRDGKVTIVENSDNIPFQVCPNPFFQNTVIKFARPLDDDYTLFLFDALGREVGYSSGIAHEEIYVDGEALPAAIYFFRILSADRTIGQGKLIKL